VDDGGLAVELGAEGGYKVVITVVLVVVVTPVVKVVVIVAVPLFRILLQNNKASEVCPTKASSPHFSTEATLADSSARTASWIAYRDRQDHWERR
jgi:hypothetical protein